MKMKPLVTAIALVLTLNACQTIDPFTREEKTSNTTKGAAIGAGVGAVVGLISGDDSRDKREKALIGAGIGALAGCVVSPITYTEYDGGTGLAIKGFTVAILGGLGNSLAAVAAGLLLGIIEAFSVSVLPLAFQDAISISILLIILFVKPHGLFGSSEAASLKEF